MINVFQPSLEAEEALAVIQVMKSNWIGKGPQVDKLLEVWATHMEVDKNALAATTCATEGLFQIVEHLGIGKGDEVVIPTIHFIGAANAVTASGAKIVFCDVDPHTLMPTWEMIKKKTSKKTKAVFILHYGGMAMPDYPDVVQGCKELEITLVEDCATAPATTWDGSVVGTGGDYAVWSFDAMKIISGGDGGIIYAKNGADDIRNRTYLGLTVESGLSSNASRWWSFGTNGPYRRAIMNDITAAIILEQFKKLPHILQTRAQLCNIYNKLLEGTRDIVLPPEAPEHSTHSYYMYWIQTASRDGLAEYLRDNGVYTTFRYYPLHKVYKQSGLPGAERAASITLSLPLHQAMKEADVVKVCGLVRKFMTG